MVQIWVKTGKPNFNLIGQTFFCW